MKLLFRVLVFLGMKQKGLYWHICHNELLGYCYNYKERVNHIKRHKLSNEVPIRLERFRQVEGRVPDLVVNTMRVLAKERKLYMERGFQERYDLTIAETNFNLALRDHESYFAELHKKECPDCPWNGHVLVFPSEGKL